MSEGSDLQQRILLRSSIGRALFRMMTREPGPAADLAKSILESEDTRRYRIRHTSYSDFEAWKLSCYDFASNMVYSCSIENAELFFRAQMRP